MKKIKKDEIWASYFCINSQAENREAFWEQAGRAWFISV